MGLQPAALDLDESARIAGRGEIRDGVPNPHVAQPRASYPNAISEYPQALAKPDAFQAITGAARSAACTRPSPTPRRV